VSNAVRRARAGLQDQNRPIGSFLFLGPTGVGKTELTKALAQFLFDDDQAMVRMDMSEYMEKHSVARLIGAPPGYVGYDEGGALTEAVRRRPYQVILFDEVEKAHPDVFNVLLQVLDDGRLTDGQGRTVDFRNTLIVLTSNLGSDILANQPEDQDTDQVRDGRLRKLLADREMKIELDTDARTWLANAGYDPVYGARPLKRVIQKELQNTLANRILAGEIKDGETIQVSAGKDGLVIKAKRAKAA
jgi:ATP-dependent Clp protease ATP-binding subunit ClpB